ncbi:hypothetical protein EJB05_45856, partial [Eragrostis curvula]
MARRRLHLRRLKIASASAFRVRRSCFESGETRALDRTAGPNCSLKVRETIGPLVSSDRAGGNAAAASRAKEQGKRKEGGKISRNATLVPLLPDRGFQTAAASTSTDEMESSTTGGDLVVSGESTASSAGSGGLQADRGGVYISFAALLGAPDLVDRKNLPRLPPPSRRAVSPSKSLLDAAATWEAPPLPAPSASAPASCPASSSTLADVAAGGSPVLGDTRTSEGIANELLNLSKGLVTIGGGMVKVFTGFGLIKDDDANQDDENSKEKEQENSDNEQNRKKPEQQPKNPQQQQQKKKPELQQQQKKKPELQQQQKKKPEPQQQQKKKKPEPQQKPEPVQQQQQQQPKPVQQQQQPKKLEEQHAVLSWLSDFISCLPVCVRKTALINVGFSEILSGPWTSSIVSIISSRTARRPEQHGCVIPVSPTPRQFGTGHIGLRALLGRQVLTRSRIDRAIVISDVYGKRRIGMPHVLPGVCIINNMAELRTAAAKFKVSDCIQLIDVHEGMVSLDEARTLWSYLLTEGAAGLLKHDSVLASLVLQGKFFMDHQNKTEAPLLVEDMSSFSRLRFLCMLLLVSYSDSSNILSLASFLRASPLIEELEMHFDASCLEGVGWGTRRSLPRWLYNYLKKVHITGFNGIKGQLEFLMHIVENAPSLKVFDYSSKKEVGSLSM